MSEFLLPGQDPAAVEAAQTAQAASRPACRMHPSVAGVALCTACGHPMCYTCSLEVPGRGVICRTCAFGRR